MVGGPQPAVRPVCRAAGVDGLAGLVSSVAEALRDGDAVMVAEESEPARVVTRYDLSGFLSEDARLVAGRPPGKLVRVANRMNSEAVLGSVGEPHGNALRHVISGSALMHGISRVPFRAPCSAN
jgi:hypothetical protein